MSDKNLIEIIPADDQTNIAESATEKTEKEVKKNKNKAENLTALFKLLTRDEIDKLPPPPAFTPPTNVKAIYVTAQSAMWTERMDYLIDFAKKTEVNSMVINIKDNEATHLNRYMADLVRRLLAENINPIARVVIFQDNDLARKRPDLALKTTKGELWGHKGFQWVDPAGREVWDYNADLSIKILDLGFTEINFDYIRFPDGDVNSIVYPFYDYQQPKTAIIKDAMKYITEKIKTARPGSILSADIFAYGLLRSDGLGIGQRFLDLVDYFDVIAPMIYPSHYATGNFGFNNPAAEPYQVVLQTLQQGNQQLLANDKAAIIRPWIQDFDMGAFYDREKIQTQIQAVTDAGHNSGWMSWNPNNVYLLGKYETINAAPAEINTKIKNTTSTY